LIDEKKKKGQAARAQTGKLKAPTQKKKKKVSRKTARIEETREKVKRTLMAGRKNKIPASGRNINGPDA